MTLEEAAEKVLRAGGLFGLNSGLYEPNEVNGILSAIKSYGDQRFLAGATAMREMAARSAETPEKRTVNAWRAREAIAEAIQDLDHNQLKDTDHG